MVLGKLYGYGDCSAYSLQVVEWNEEENPDENLKQEGSEPEETWPCGKSPIEARLAEILKLINPNFKMNQYIGIYEVDFLYEKEKIVIEANGKAFHNPEKDSIKENYLLKYGYLVIPVSGTDIMNRSYEVYKRLKWIFTQLGFRTSSRIDNRIWS
jgi:very-short-patch-repair endonuclease